MKIPKVIHACCFIIALIYIIVFFRIEHDEVSKNLLLFFFPSIATPYLFWVIHNESMENTNDQLKEYYQSPFMMWAVRLFMMFITSVMYALAAIIFCGAVAKIYSFF